MLICNIYYSTRELECILLFSRCEGITDQTENGWWIVFAPLFVADALNAYFCVIVLIRMYLEALYKVFF